MFYQFMLMIENLLGKMYIEGAFVSKSRNISLRMVFTDEVVTDVGEW